MTTLVSILCLGFFLGMRHATDTDHVVAVATIVSRQRSMRGAAFTGISWGVGHSLAMLLIGGAIVLFGLVIPARLGLGLEFSVGLMLIVLGILNLGGILRSVRAAIPESMWLDARENRRTPTRDPMLLSEKVRPVMIGIIHGLAGSAAVALLVLPIIQNPLWAMAYLLIFGVGTITGMMLITAVIAMPFLYASTASDVLKRWMAGATGVLSIGFGGFMVYEIGFVEGLLRP